MKVSLNEIKRLGYEDVVAAPIDQLVEVIGTQLGAVEDVEELGAKYQNVLVARIVSCNDHPNADRLRVCLIDDGGKTHGIARNEAGHIQVVCGAPNVREGLLVAWLPPGATVPETYHHETPFILDARELRGVVSNGMLASPKELALGDSHEGILEIDVSAEPGQDFADIYHLNDHIIDIENKMFTHRPDCFGLLGVARELAGIQQMEFVSPGWWRDEPVFSRAEGLSLELINDEKERAPRVMAVAMRNITVAPSPMWLQTALLRLGARPISNVVDITNYLMLLTGQPLHAYDYDKVGSKTLGVRLARAQEQIELLSGKSVALHENDLVITDGEHAIGLAGVMGGASTEVGDETKNIIIEVANFDMYSIRRTSMRHGLFTDAVTRFNKGQSALQVDRVMAKALEFFTELTGGVVASEIQESRLVKAEDSTVNTTAEFINNRLGLTLNADAMAALLRNVEFNVVVEGDALAVTAPFWRTDISLAEDIVEEVGRLYGFDKLPLELPARTLRPAQKNPAMELKRLVRRSLSRSGANETLTYSFVHEKLLTKAGQSADEAFKLSNALSPDLQYFRLSVLPSLLEKVHLNIRAGYEEFALFEIGKSHNARLHANDDNGLPAEPGLIDMVYVRTAKINKPGSAYYNTRRLLDQLASDLGLEFEYTPHDGDDQDSQLVKPFDMDRSAYVTIKGTEQLIGFIGEYRQEVSAAFKLPKHAAGFTLGVEELVESLGAKKNTYRSLSRFPGTSQDICFRVPAATAFADLERSIEDELLSVSQHTDTELIDIYQGDDTDHKQVTFRITLTDYNKTMTSKEASDIITAVIQKVTADHDARVV